MSGFDVNRSQVSATALADFLAEETREDITSVPGIGLVAAAMLATDLDTEPGVTTTYQLIGMFLLMRKPGMTSQEHCDAFWNWLRLKGVSSHRAGIVHCVAEKVSVWMPGVY